MVLIAGNFQASTSCVDCIQFDGGGTTGAVVCAQVRQTYVSEASSSVFCGLSMDRWVAGSCSRTAGLVARVRSSGEELLEGIVCGPEFFSSESWCYGVTDGGCDV